MVTNCHTLLTGFEPFTTGLGLTLEHNPTADIAVRIGAQLEDVQAVVLPVSYSETPKALTRAFETHRPRKWLGLGFAPHRTSLDIELFALNMAHAVRGDNDGACPQLTPIIPDGPTAYRTGLDVSSAIRIFADHGVRAMPSFHAGTFLCNQTFYLASQQCAQETIDLAAFIHVPPMKDYRPFEEGLSVLLERL